MEKTSLPIVETFNVILIFKRKIPPITSESIREIEKVLREKGIQRKEIKNIKFVLNELMGTETRQKRKNRRVHFITDEEGIREKILQALRQNPQGLICEEIGKEIYGYPVSSMKTLIEYQVSYRILHGLMKEGKVTTEKIRDKLTSFGGKAARVYKLVE